MTTTTTTTTTKAKKAARASSDLGSSPLFKRISPRTAKPSGKAKPSSAIMAAIHEAASDLHEAGLISKQTMRDFDDRCLTVVPPLSAEEIRALRVREKVSQDVFASHLNVSKDVVSKWERGKKRPAGTALKLLALVKKNGLSTIA